jgi:hypothetical protein
LELSVTVCSWNTRADLAACLQSLHDARGEAEFETIVVDNASHDGSPEMVRERFPWVRLIALEVNLGFTGGQNLALAQREGRHAFLLNSDAAVHPGAIREVLDFASREPCAGIVGPKVLNPDGSLQLSCRRFPNPIAALFRNTPLGKLLPNNRFTREYLMQDWPHNEPREVDWVSGAAMFVRQEVLERVGLFDPAYFMYCEDVDLCWRARKAGFGVFYCPSALVSHAIGKSTDQAANRMILRFHRSMLYFYTKNMLPDRPAILRPLLWLGAAAALSARAGMFIAKNALDEVRRRLHV